MTGCLLIMKSLEAAVLDFVSQILHWSTRVKGQFLDMDSQLLNEIVITLVLLTVDILTLIFLIIRSWMYFKTGMATS